MWRKEFVIKLWILLVNMCDRSFSFSCVVKCGTNNFGKIENSENSKNEKRKERKE